MYQVCRRILLRRHDISNFATRKVDIYRNTEMRAETGSDPMSGHQINLVGDHCVPILSTNKHQGVPPNVFGRNSAAQRLAADQG